MIFVLDIGVVALGAGAAIGALGAGFAGGFIDCAMAAVLIKAAIAAAEAMRIIMEGSFSRLGIEPVPEKTCSTSIRSRFHAQIVPRRCWNLPNFSPAIGTENVSADCVNT
jgi:hypothetical protein